MARALGYRPAMPPAEGPEVAVFTPALLLFIEIHDDTDGRPDVHVHAGGQGFWMARMVQALGATPIPCSPVGGESGVALGAILRAAGMPARLSSNSRPNSVVIEDRRGGQRTEIAVTEVPPLGRHEVDELYSAVVGAAIRAGVCLIAGTQLDPALPDDVFRRLVADLRRNGVLVIADLSGSPLRAALASGVDVIKISHEELIRDGWATGDGPEEVMAGIARLRGAGAGAVVVSRSSRSSLAGFEHRLVEVRSPSLEVVDHRGGGDSMTAALAVAAATGRSFEDALRLAAAAGALNVSRQGLGSGRIDAIEEIADRAEVRDLRRDGRRRHPATDERLADLSRRELYEMAQHLDIAGRSTMTHDELVAAITRTATATTPAGAVVSPD